MNWFHDKVEELVVMKGKVYFDDIGAADLGEECHLIKYCLYAFMIIDPIYCLAYLILLI